MFSPHLDALAKSVGVQFQKTARGKIAIHNGESGINRKYYAFVQNESELEEFLNKMDGDSGR